MTLDLAKDQAWKPMVSLVLIGHVPIWFVFLVGRGRVVVDSPFVFTHS